MGDKTLKSKAIDIKGKSYVLVSDRVLYFNDTYPKGSITTELVSWDDGVIVIKATVIPDEGRMFTGYSQAKVGDGYINKTSALENAETSAVGRALAMMGIGVIESIASADEINKAKTTPTEEAPICATCGAKMTMSKAGNYYCPKAYSKDPNNPHTKKTELSPNEQAFVQSLDGIPVVK